jgi:HPt (histidine-containing phosphotransfer) domain-containing protein
VRTVGAQDNDLVLNAARRLKTKSWLIGALRMNQLCGELELALALADWDAAAAVARDIELHFPHLQKALGDVPELTHRTRRPRKLQDAMAS